MTTAHTTIVEAHEMVEGAGARIRRLFPVPSRHHHDPFVLLDEFFVAPGTGFPRHPHRGFEAITYIFEGAFRHEDNLGHATTVGAGGAQRFTAGRGLVHSEMPEGDAVSHGIQLWINLARSDKAIDPAYQQVDPADIPERRQDGATVRVIVGAGSPVTVRTPMRYGDVRLAAGATHVCGLAPGWTSIVYVTSGAAEIDGARLGAGQAAIGQSAGQIRISALEEARFVVIAGRPHGEPITLRGTFVE